MNKKVIALLSALVFLLPCATAEGKRFADTEEESCASAVSVLSDIGIISGKSEETYEPDSPLTRAEMAAIILRAMNMEGIGAGSGIFDDVTPAHWAYKDVTTAYNMGLVTGISERIFSPDAPVTYAQAVKMMVCALGYGVQAEALGGYPGGYFAKASQLGLLKGTSDETDGVFTRGSMAIMVYNCLSVELSVRESYGGSHSFTGGKGTLLSYYLDIKVFEDTQIVANYLTDLTDSLSVRKNEIAITDGTVMNAGETNAADLIGRKVTIYAKDDGIDIAVLSVEDKSEEEYQVIFSGDILAKTTASRFYYDINGKEKDIAIDNDAKVAVNGKLKPGYTADDIIPDNGTVTLIMNSSGAADVILVETYETYVVDSKDSEKNVVYFKEASDGTGSLVIDLTDSSKKISFVNTKGESLSVDDLASWDILSAAISEDGHIMKVIKCSETVEGTIIEKSDDEVKINETVYKLSGSSTKPALGQTATYRLDFMGRIAAVDTETSKVVRYAYLVSCSNTNGLDPYPQLKLFTQDGEMKIYNTSDKVKLNGSTIDKSALLPKSGDNALTRDGSCRRQLIRYKTNEDGTQITEIETAVDYRTDPDNEEKYQNFSLELYIDGDQYISDGINRLYNSKVTYIGSTVGAFASRYLPRDDTKIFVIPEANAKDEDYKLKKYNTLTHGDDGETYTNMYFYDTNEYGIVGAMVWDVGATGGEILATYPTHLVPVAVITDIKKGITEDGETTTIINITDWNGKDITVTGEGDFKCLNKNVNTDMDTDPFAPTVTDGIRIESSMPMKELKIGDIIQYEADANGKATLIHVLFRANTPGMVEMNYSKGRLYITDEYRNYKGEIYLGNGIVKKVGDSSMIVEVRGATTAGTPSGLVYKRAFSLYGKIYLVNRKKRTVSIMLPVDICEGDMLMSIWRSNSQMMLLVYR